MAPMLRTGCRHIVALCKALQALESIDTVGQAEMPTKGCLVVVHGCKDIARLNRNDVSKDVED